MDTQKVWVINQAYGGGCVGAFFKIEDALGACFDHSVKETMARYYRFKFTLAREELRGDFIAGAYNDYDPKKIGHWHFSENRYTVRVLKHHYEIVEVELK